MDRPQLLQEKGRSEAQQNQIPSEPAGSASKQEKFVRPLRRPALPCSVGFRAFCCSPKEVRNAKMNMLVKL